MFRILINLIGSRLFPVMLSVLFLCGCFSDQQTTPHFEEV